MSEYRIEIKTAADLEKFKQLKQITTEQIEINKQLGKSVEEYQDRLTDINASITDYNKKSIEASKNSIINSVQNKIGNPELPPLKSTAPEIASSAPTTPGQSILLDDEMYEQYKKVSEQLLINIEVMRAEGKEVDDLEHKYNEMADVLDEYEKTGARVANFEKETSEARKEANKNIGVG